MKKRDAPELNEADAEFWPSSVFASFLLIGLYIGDRLLCLFIWKRLFFCYNKGQTKQGLRSLGTFYLCVHFEASKG